MERLDERNIAVNVMEIMKILPHRYPMLLIDTILEYEAGIFAVAKKSFSYNEEYLQGHYPGKPIVPGTVLLESLSQAASFALLSDEKCKGCSLLFTGVNKLRFLKTVFPGDCMVCRVNVIQNRHGLISIRGEGTVNEQVCINAEMTFMMRNF